MLLICYLFLITQSAKILEYRFGFNYGQIFRDFSNNGLHAVNGVSHLDLVQDTFATDRGAYFEGNLQTITMPKNSIVGTEIILKQPLTVICWVMALNSEGQLFTRDNSATDHLIIGRVGIDYSSNQGRIRRRSLDLNQLTFDGLVFGNSSGLLYGGPDSFLKGKNQIDQWVMIALVISYNLIQVYQNLIQVVQYSFPSNYLETGSYFMCLGSGDSSINSIQGFIWYFAILDNETDQTNFISLSDSEVPQCLTSYCSYCDYYVIDPYQGMGCISTVPMKNQDSNGILCPSPDSGCSTDGSLICNCLTNSCYQSGVNNYCWCPENVTIPSSSNCFCPVGFNFIFDVCCESSCKSCRENSTCISCIDTNSVPDRNLGCKCNDGFYGKKPLISNQSCIECNIECKTCEDGSNCTSCKSWNASPNPRGGCACDSGFFGSYPLNNQNSCQPCHVECLTCQISDICLSCKALNSSPSPRSGCVCNNKFYNIGILNSPSSCIACNTECDTCNSEGICTTCIALNSIPSLTGGCDCIDSYYSQGQLTNLYSCIPCHSDCKTCDNSNTCLICSDKNAKPNIFAGCICNKGYFFDEFLKNCKSCPENCLECTSETCLLCQIGTYGPLCLKCNSKCQTCSGPGFYQCLSCSELMIQNTCSASCPIGFKSIQNICIYDKLEIPTIKFIFNGLGDVYIDEYNNVTASISKGSKRILANSVPTVALNRGIYFPGSSALEISENSKIFNNDFSISIWIRPKTSSGVIISKYDGSKVLNCFKLYYNEYSVSANILINQLEESVKYSKPLILNMWNYLLITVNHTTNTMVYLKINNQEEIFMFKDPPFTDSESSFMMIGSDLLIENTFKGFIFSIEVYASFVDPKLLVSVSSCMGCNICLVSGKCLSLCEIEEFLDEKTNSCENCPKFCLESCLNSNTCLSCADPFCDACSSFETGSCYECFLGYELKYKSCEKCKENEYFDISKKICRTCPLLCSICDSFSQCIKCEQNAKIVEFKCVCEEGFTLKNQCIRNYFTAELQISETNSVILIFSESLQKILQKNMIVVQIDAISVGFSIVIESMSKYYIKIKDDDIQRDSVLLILFVTKLVSYRNSLLELTQLEGNLHLTEQMKAERDLENKKNALKSVGRIGMTTGVSLGLLVAIVNQEPTSLFDFLNTAEILYSVFLFDYQLHPVLSEFLQGMRLQGSIPNFFYLVLDSSKGVKLPALLKNFGYVTNLLILNIGPYLASLIGIVFTGLFFWIISKIPYCKSKLASTLQNYRFSAFLRFWIQSFYEICTALVYSFKYNTRENTILIIDYVFSFIFATAEFTGLCLMIYLIKVRRNLSESEEIQNFMKKFGTFFEEFKSRGLRDWIFYILFISRRIVLVFCYSFIKNAGVQLAFSLFFSLLTSFYFLRIQPHNQRIYTIYHFINEIIISIYVLVLIISFSESTLHTSEFKADLCIYLVYTTWGLNFGCSLMILTQKIVKKIKEMLNRRIKNTEIKYINKTAPDVIEKIPKVQTLHLADD